MTVTWDRTPRWEQHWAEVDPLTLSFTYEASADWVRPCSQVEDWGCGMGWPLIAGLLDPEQYRGIDATDTGFVDEVVDLTDYRSETSGLLMRHVLEHSYHWRNILDNAMASFSDRFALVLFTPFQERTAVLEELSYAPVIAFRQEDILGRIRRAGGQVKDVQEHQTDSQFGVETVIKVEGAA